MNLQEQLLQKLAIGKQLSPVDNKFISNITNQTTTWNGAVSNKSTGSELVDDFSRNGTYISRDVENVFNGMDILWNENKDLALASIFYIRAISRKTKFKKDSYQTKGQGKRDEFLKRLLWLAYNHSKTFEENLYLVPVIGRWKDLWDLVLIDFENRIDRNVVYKLIASGLADKSQFDLVAKYLPLLKAKSKTKSTRHKLLNVFVKEFLAYLGITPKELRQIKTNGNAHTWQKLVSIKKYDKIDFNTIGGQAINHLVISGWIDRHNQTNKYIKFLDDNDKIKFNGYPYDLVKSYEDCKTTICKYTINKQFKTLLENSEPLQGNILCALDTSGSMQWDSVGKYTPYDVCIGLGIYFSSLNTGAFKDVVAMFDDTTEFLKLNGEFTNKLHQIQTTRTAWGSTNFLSVIDAIVEFRKSNPNVSLDDYPTTLLVVSDMQFNPTGSKETNYREAMKRLASVGLGEMKIVWWQVNSETKDVPSTLDDKGTFVISGFDGNVISLLLGKEVVETNQQPKDMYELMVKAYTQPLFKKLVIKD